MKNAVEISDLSFTYPDGTPALQGLSLSVPKGARVALMGPNGAGKSTLIFHLNGLYLPQEGRVVVLGREVSKQNRLWLKEKVGLVFQDPDDQLIAPTVWEDVAFGPLNMGLPAAEVKDRVERALHAVEALGLKEKAPFNLSFGQKRRVAIAGVLAMEPEIIVLDEPSAFLDAAGQEAVFSILESFHEQGRTIIVATHDVDLAAEWADNLLLLREGRLVASGPPELLTDIEVTEASGLRQPVVTRLFDGIDVRTARGLPYRLEQGRKVLKELCKRKPHADAE